MFAPVDGFYPDSAAKVSLVIAVGQSAKEHLVEEFGIGEEIALNLIGWTGDRFTCLAQIDTSWGDMSDMEERVDRVHRAAVTMRRGFGVDAFTILAEGFVGTKPERSRGKDLIDEFANNEQSGVKECLSIVHVENEGEDVEICAQPFRMNVGKSVDFGGLLHAEGTEMLRNPEYVDVLTSALTHWEHVEVPDHEIEQFHLSCAMGLADEAGFFLQYEF